MIKVTFKDGTKRNYKVGCRDLLCGSWDGVGYFEAFRAIEKLIDAEPFSMYSWRVI